MLKDEEIVQRLAEFLDSGIEEEGIVLYDYLLERLTESGLVKLIEAGQAMRKHAPVVLEGNQNFYKAEASWDIALEALAGVSGATSPEKENEMQPHQERVIAEKKELDEKLCKLEAFFSYPLFGTLPVQEQQRLSKQASLMHQYSDVLGERIAAF